MHHSLGLEERKYTPYYVTINDYPPHITKDVTVLVINCSSTYNSIVGWPTLNSWKTMTSTYHLMIKFPTEYRVGKVHGDQVAARECYVAMLEMDNHLQTMSTEEQQKVAESIEGLKGILLDNSRLE